MGSQELAFVCFGKHTFNHIFHLISLLCTFPANTRLTREESTCVSLLIVMAHFWVSSCQTDTSACYMPHCLQRGACVLQGLSDSLAFSATPGSTPYVAHLIFHRDMLHPSCSGGCEAGNAAGRLPIHGTLEYSDSAGLPALGAAPSKGALPCCDHARWSQGKGSCCAQAQAVLVHSCGWGKIPSQKQFRGDGLFRLTVPGYNPLLWASLGGNS